MSTPYEVEVQCHCCDKPYVYPTRLDKHDWQMPTRCPFCAVPWVQNGFGDIYKLGRGVVRFVRTKGEEDEE